MFEVIAPPKGSVKLIHDVNKVRLRTRRRPRGDGYFIELIVGREVARRMGWTNEASVSIAWGVDRSFGKVKIGPHTDGPSWLARPNKAGSAWKIMTSALPDTWANQPMDELLAFEVIPTAATERAPFIILTLPKAFHSKED